MTEWGFKLENVRYEQCKQIREVLGAGDIYLIKNEFEAMSLGIALPFDVSQPGNKISTVSRWQKSNRLSSVAIFSQSTTSFGP